MCRVGEISIVGVRSDQICSLAPVTVPVVLMPQFNRLATRGFFTFLSALREVLHHTSFSTQKLTPSNCTPAEWMLCPSYRNAVGSSSILEILWNLFYIVTDILCTYNNPFVTNIP